jgi:crotonobetaine/carnitine-CoA ligase
VGSIFGADAQGLGYGQGRASHALVGVLMMGKPIWRNIGMQWSGAPLTTVPVLVCQACERHHDHPAIIFEEGLVVTQRELLGRAEAFAGYLQTRIGRGDRVAMIVGNRAEFMIAWLAVVAIRATLVALNPDAKVHDAGYIFRDSGAVMAIIDDEHQSLIDTLKPQCPALRDVIVVGSDEPDGLLPYCSKSRPLRLRESPSQLEDITNIFYTSGTTGPPKGCLVDHHWWLRTVDVLLRRTPAGPDDRQLCCLQFFYGDPVHQLLECLHTGGALVVMRRFSVSRFWALYGIIG